MRLPIYKLCYVLSVEDGKGKKKKARKRSALTDSIATQSVQGNVQLTKRGTLSVKSWKWIQDYVLGVWARADD